MLALAACERSPQEPASRATRDVPNANPAPESSSADNAKSAQAERSAPLPVSSDGSLVSATYRMPDAERIVAVGDLHGDFSATERAFALAGVIDAGGHWTGGETVVVQTGDQLDRGDDERLIVEFLRRLSGEAKAVGGAVYVLNGNHETMNVLGDFRYVNKAALDSFAGYEPASPLAQAVTSPYRGRAEVFLPGGGGARLFAERPIVLMVGTTVFAHGGVLPSHVEYGIDRLNAETRAWMLAERSLPPPLIVDEDGPVWTRRYGAPKLDDAACRVLAKTLSLLGAQRMVVGHTVQEKGLSGACGDTVFRIDVGLAKHYGHRPAQVLEITKAGVRVLTAS